MIEKERLEELIKEEATIYLCTLSDVKEMTYNTIPIFLKRNWEDYKDRMYETKEDAEFALRFKRIPKTEYLDLPTWEEFCKMSEKEDDKSFFYKGSTYLLRNDVDEIKIIEQYYDDISYIFNKPLTKENYIKACELCRKLFLGEEI